MTTRTTTVDTTDLATALLALAEYRALLVHSGGRFPAGQDAVVQGAYRRLREAVEAQR